MKQIAALLLITALFSGCGGGESSSDASSQVDNTPALTISQRLEGINSTKSLEASLDVLATQTSLSEFTVVGLDLSVAYVVRDYFYSFMADYILEFDALSGENLAKSSTILSGYMEEIYIKANDTSSSQTSWWLFGDDDTTEPTIIDKIIEAIIQYIKNLINPPEKVIVPDTSYTITPSSSYEFHPSDINGQTYYVASDQYMSVTFAEDGESGRGDIGFGLGADFTSYISGSKLYIDMNNIYEITKVYEDKGANGDTPYCIASTMKDNKSGEIYDAFWFADKDDYKKAEDIALAESLCYIHSSDYTAPVIATDGILEPIKDERAGHLPVAQETTSTMVESLLNGVNNTATVTDAKYFARSMRHGVFAIYTTNNQTHTLQAKETAKIMREVLPLGASSAINMQELMGSAYDSSVAFQTEVNRDLNNSTKELNARFDELIVATSEAMDRTTSDNGYHGVSEVTSYGDIVEFQADNIKSACGLAFFLCNKATADVTMNISNPATNGREADIEFTTQITTSIVGSSDIDFNNVDDSSQRNYISSSDYTLNISDFNYNRESGLMKIKGDGSLGSASVMTFNSYEIVALFEENPSLKLLNFITTVDGNITTQEGRVFNGTLVFDGANTSNSKMDGNLVGINEEPTIDGLFQTSLDLADINGWLDDHSGLSATFNNIGEQSYFMKVSISKDDKLISADMLVHRDESADTWTYLVKDLVASDVNGKMKAAKVYLTQRGANTLAESLEKIATSGMNLDTDIQALINLGWDVASDFNNIGIEELEMTMKPESGDVKIATTLHVVNENSTMRADLNTTYDYADTHLSAIGDFETIVTVVDSSNSYENKFTTEGMIKVDNLFNYRYALDYTSTNQYIIFTRADNSYQMGFVIRETEIKGADSYGVLADFKMNETYDVLKNMTLTNTADNELGVYDRATNALEIKFSDKSKEYMYLY